MNPCGRFSMPDAVFCISIGDFLFSLSSILVHIIEASISFTILIKPENQSPSVGINDTIFDAMNATEVICWIYLGINVSNILLSILLWQAVIKESILKCISYLVISPIVIAVGLLTVVFHGFVLGTNPYYYALAMYPSYWTYKLFALWITSKFLQELRTSPSELRRRRKNEYSKLDGSYFNGENNESFQNYDEEPELKLHKKFEISEEKLEIDYKTCLDTEEHNAVIRGMLELENGKFCEVSVKTLKVTTPTIPHSNRLLKEAQLLALIGLNDHLLKFFGICVKSKLKDKLFVVSEYYSRGTLDAFLKDCVDTYGGKTFTNLINEYGRINNPHEKVYENLPISKLEFNTVDLLKWSYQIASALEHLHTKRVIYGCLQARSVVLMNSGAVKLTGLSFAAVLHSSNKLVRREDLPNRFPLRWTALECITSTDNIRFTTRSDIWSFAVTLWQIFSLGNVPYGAWDTDIVRNLMSGTRLDKPQYAPTQIYEIMKACWRKDPIERPNFSLLKLFFEQLLSSIRSRTSDFKN